MAAKAQAGYHFLVLLVLLCSVSCLPSSLAVDGECFNLTGFQNDFLFGAASSAYQVEGVKARGLNNWDSFTHRYPEKSDDGSNADVAIDSYDLYEDDIALMKDMGLQAYRFSIA